MQKPEKPKRTYQSHLRNVQASETRRSILDAARKLFVQNGFSGASIEAIASEASVAPETIYAAFKNKRNLLARLIDLSVGGDEQRVPLMDRPGPRAVMREPNPSRQMELFASDISAILERTAPIFEVVRMAAKTEPEIELLLQKLLDARMKNMIPFMQSVADHNGLRAGLTVPQAAETAWALSSPDLYNLLTRDHGWTREQFAAWLSDSLTRLLLNPDAKPPSLQQPLLL